MGLTPDEILGGFVTDPQRRKLIQQMEVEVERRKRQARYPHETIDVTPNGVKQQTHSEASIDISPSKADDKMPWD